MENYLIRFKKKHVFLKIKQLKLWNRFYLLFIIAIKRKLYIGKLNINLRDLKPENLIYETEKEGSILKVIDFGTSREFDVN